MDASFRMDASDVSPLSTPPNGLSIPVGEDDAPPLHLHARGERIAIVDDEKMVLTVVENALQAFGYDTVAFDSTPRFLKAFSAASEPFDLLITDLTMPGMTGLDLARKLRQSGQELPILIMTGFSKHLRSDSVRGLGKVSLLKKPFTRAHLVQAVRRLVSSYSAV